MHYSVGATKCWRFILDTGKYEFLSTTFRIQMDSVSPWISRKHQCKHRTRRPVHPTFTKTRRFLHNGSCAQIVIILTIGNTSDQLLSLVSPGCYNFRYNDNVWHSLGQQQSARGTISSKLSDILDHTSPGKSIQQGMESLEASQPIVEFAGG
jgi:hypothetical protein